MWKKKYYRHPSALKGGIEEEIEGKKRKNKKKGGGRSDRHATAIERTHTPHTQHTSTTKNDIGRKKKKKEGRGGGGNVDECMHRVKRGKCTHRVHARTSDAPTQWRRSRARVIPLVHPPPAASPPAGTSRWRPDRRREPASSARHLYLPPLPSRSPPSPPTLPKQGTQQV